MESENITAVKKDPCNTCSYVMGNILFTHGKHYFEIMLDVDPNCYDRIGVAEKLYSGKRAPGYTPDTWCIQLHHAKNSSDYKFTGVVHNGEVKPYYGQWNKGDAVGVFLDLDKGTLQFFCNNEPLGVAFDNVKTIDGLCPIANLCHDGSRMTVRNNILLPFAVANAFSNGD